MPIYRHFYIEHLGTAGWVLPAAFEAEPWTFECDHAFGGFAWAHSRCAWLDLFWSPNALFPMRAGPPDDRRGSPLLQHLGTFYDFGRNEDDLCWIPYTELVIDCWEKDLVTVGAPIAAKYALLFEDGLQRFPRAELIGANAPESELDHLRERSLVREPVHMIFGRQRYRVAELPPDAAIDVTWRETIAEFIGEPHASLFRGLRRYGRDEDLRILSRRG